MNENYLQAAESFIEKIKIWNWDDFGNISHKMKCILVWLWDIRKALESYPSNNLIQLESELKKELKMVMTQEEILWYQKLRCD